MFRTPSGVAEGHILSTFQKYQTKLLKDFEGEDH